MGSPTSKERDIRMAELNEDAFASTLPEPKTLTLGTPTPAPQPTPTQKDPPTLPDPIVIPPIGSGPDTPATAADEEPATIKFEL